MSTNIQVAIIGAGPAGLFAAEKLAEKGYGVVVFNRDIKPGGMAEYGIYPKKHAVKEGLRKQFAHTLSSEHIHYYGNVYVGEGGCISIKELQNWGVPAILVACGAQGTKWLGIPGESLTGVYHAKDVVFKYNRLPPFSTMPIEIGRRVVIVGAGNVMADVARYLLSLHQVEEVHICVRRGPAEVKFTKKELETIVHAIDLEALGREIDRVAPLMRSLGQDPEREFGFYGSILDKADPGAGKAKMLMHFLVSPVEILGNEMAKVNTLLLEDNTLIRDGQNTLARGLGTRQRLEADTVIFAIGDRVEDKLGIPVSKYDYRHAQEPLFPVDGQSYEVEDPQTGKPWKGIFLAGWSRIASSGLVGNAKKDGTNAAEAISSYLRSQGPNAGIPLQALEERVASTDCTVVRKDDLTRLLVDERNRATKGNPEEVPYLTDEEMLKVMELK